ncbi:MAG: group III truncated hemoglobin [Flavobacteriales bacterium]|nr:group III truncated hemoglobin [Flavobacteriales bacterium]
MNDIINLDDVKLVVDCFYEKVRNDEQLKDVFNNVIQDRWPAHLEKMYRFWQTVLLGEHTYFGSPFVPHARLPVEKQHFERWLNLFYETVDEYFIGELAEKAKWQGERMAQMFNMKINHYRSHPNQKVL